MKKYSSYFNKRYFPETDDMEEEEPLSGESLSQTPSEPEEPVAAAPAPTPTPAPVSAPAAVPAAPAPTPAPAPIPKPAPMQSVPPMTASRPAPKAPSEAFGMGGRGTFAFPAFDDEPEVKPEPKSSAFAPSLSFSIPDVDSEQPKTEGEITVISESAIITGELTVSGNVRMMGKIKGNLTATGNLEIDGKVIGNLSGNDVELKHCELKGDVNATGFTFMDKDSIMIGNLSAKEVTLDGKVKGDISASHKVYVRSNAVVVGNIKASIIAIDEGAALQGQVIIASKGNSGLDIGEESEP